MQLADSPAIRAAIAEETRIRSEAFLVEAPPLLCGIELAPLTVRRWDRLRVAQSPFAFGGPIGAADIAVFAWAMHPHYAPGAWFRRWCLVRRLRRLDFAAAAAAAEAIVAEALLDRPAVASGAQGSCRFHWASFIVDRLAAAYGWSETEILDLPLARAFQYVALVRLRTDPDAVCFNPLSDRAKRQVLKDLKEKQTDRAPRE